jgi:hypothetical protein
MPYERYSCQGTVFLFKFEEDHPELLHIYVRHLATPEQAIDLFFDEVSQWNETRQRFENYSDTHGLYWCWQDEKNRVVRVISCFRK